MKANLRSRFITPTRSSTTQASGLGSWRPLIRFQKQNLTVRLLAMMLLLAGLQQAVAQPTILSTVPSNGATGVSPGAAVVFTFSTAMNPTATSALFLDITAGENPTVVPVWSAGNTVLTCTPSPAFANNHNIQWDVSGQDTVGNDLVGTTEGSFTTVLGVNSGSGTNAVTTFVVGKYALYNQTSSAPPPLLTHEFYAQTTLSSNRTATGITVTIPVTSGVSNLVEDGLQPEKFSKTVYNPNLTNFDATFPAGNYVFNVSATASNQQVTVNLPGYSQPNGPVVSNYTAAQAIDPSQPFTLTWNTFTNGGSADLVLFFINGSSGITLFQTPNYGQSGALSGTATSVTIPAATLPASSTNQAELVFYHLTTTSGGTATEAFVGSATGLAIKTTAGSAGAPAPVLAIIRSGTNVLVEWPTNATGYTLQFSTNLASSVWNTNLPTPVVVNTNKVVTNGISGTQRFFRLSNP